MRFELRNFFVINMFLVLVAGLAGAQQAAADQAAKKPASSAEKAQVAPTSTAKTPKKSGTSNAKSSGKTGASAGSSHAASSGKTQASRRRRGGSRRGAWKRKGQQVIQPERAREIQEALIREHYLTGEPTGKWDARSQAAMVKYQADNGWQSKVTPDSRALIKLGLGPDYSKQSLNMQKADAVASANSSGGSAAGQDK